MSVEFLSHGNLIWRVHNLKNGGRGAPRAFAGQLGVCSSGNFSVGEKSIDQRLVAVVDPAVVELAVPDVVDKHTIKLRSQRITLKRLARDHDRPVWSGHDIDDVEEPAIARDPIRTSAERRIRVVPATTDRPYKTLVTTGMSEYAMTAPTDASYRALPGGSHRQARGIPELLPNADKSAAQR